MQSLFNSPWTLSVLLRYIDFCYSFNYFISKFQMLCSKRLGVVLNALEVPV
jgi:hypothetical protein